jgi:hypothetical protein
MFSMMPRPGQDGQSRAAHCALSETSLRRRFSQWLEGVSLQPCLQACSPGRFFCSNLTSSPPYEEEALSALLCFQIAHTRL